MTPQDREQFQALTRRQMQLEEALQQLRVELKEWERRAESSQAHVSPAALPPPLPAVIETVAPAVRVPLPVPEYLMTSVPAVVPQTPPHFPSLPIVPAAPKTTPPAPKADNQGGLEFQFGRWLARIGAVFALITLITFSTWAYHNYHQYMGPWTKLAVLATVSIGLIAAGLRFERKDSKMIVYGRTMAGGGLACLYYTIYGATYVESLRVIASPFLGGLLLLAWSAYVLYLAEKKQSELLSIFSIALAYFSSAVNPVGEFTMVANLLLSLTAVIFLVRNAWTGLSYLCLVGTYAGLLRQFVYFDNLDFAGLQFLQTISFWPAAVYLAGAWVIYTAGVFLATTPHFAAGKRMAFLCLNNGALIGLLTLVASLSHFGHIGTILCIAGGAFIAASWLAQQVHAESGEVADAYLMQGLALATGGVVMVYSGVTRGLLITVETVFLAAAGAYARNAIMRTGAIVTALLGALFLGNEICSGTAHPWVLILGGTAAMFANAWLARHDLWTESREIAAKHFVTSSAYYLFLAMGLLGIGIDNRLTDDWSAPVMALTAAALTFAVYWIPLFELPIMAQLLLLFAFKEAFAPFNDSHSWWSEGLTGLATMALAFWWPRQKILRTDAWLPASQLVYAVALAALSFCAVHPHVDAQGWMIGASLLSLGFLLLGMVARTWSFALTAQFLLASAISTFFSPAPETFPWTWWAASTPIAVTFLTAWLTREWLKRPESAAVGAGARDMLKLVVRLYQVLTLILIVRLVYGVAPESEVAFCFYALGTALIAWNLKWPNSMGVRCGMTLDMIGTFAYLSRVSGDSPDGAIARNAAGMILLLAQPALLRYWGKDLVTRAESWLLILISSGTAWLFVSHSIDTMGSLNQTMGWAFFALALIIIGFAANERRQRWCGLFILLAAIVRGGVYDYWKLPDLYKVLTFFVLTVICLGLSFLYYKFADRLKEWL